MQKIDLKKDLKHLYQPSAKEVVQVEVPTFNFLMIDGEGNPNTTQTYAEAIDALFSISYNEVIEAAIAEVWKKKKLPGVSKLRFESFTEGCCAQILHIGPFSEEGPTIERLHDFIDSRASRTGKHHEIYLSDIRRTEPKKWKTIIRHPML